MRYATRFFRRHPRVGRRILGLRRRLGALAGGASDPYPAAPEGMHLSPSEAHIAEYGDAPLKLAWTRAGIAEPAEWQDRARRKLAELMGYARRAAPPRPTAAAAEPLPGGLRRQAFYLESGPRSHVPVNVVWAEEFAGERRPVMLCLQGHTSGAHISWGEMRVSMDPVRIARGADYALQAVGHGYVAVCIEQRCFGERREQRVEHRWEHPCVDAANRALLLGRTLLAERAIDVSSVLDWLETAAAGPALDGGRIHAMGNSAGGECALYAAALDSRISAVIASGCVGRFRATSGRRKTCPDTVVPGVLNWLEYDDVIALCAPRVVLAVSGANDHIYPFAEAEACVNGAAAVYRAMGASENLDAVRGAGGHRFYPEIAWPRFLEMVGAPPA